MDQDRRAQLHARREELYARREALLAEHRRKAFAARRAAYVASVPILRAIEEAGHDYDSFGYGGLSDSLNFWAHDPHRWAMLEDSHAVLPASQDACEEVVADALRARFGDDEPVTVILRWERLVLILRLPLLLHHLGILLENGRSQYVAFAAPPANWIVAVRQCEVHGINEIVTGRLPDDFD